MEAQVVVGFEFPVRVFEYGLDLIVEGIVQEAEETNVSKIIVLNGNCLMIVREVAFGMRNDNHARAHGPFLWVFPDSQE